MDADMEDAPLTKTQLRDVVPKRISALRFGLLSSQDIVAQSVVEVSDRHVYDIGDGASRPVTKHGPLDPRLGTSSRGTLCETCGREMKDCNGHFGYVKLSLPAFHVGYLKKIIEVLQCICKECSRVMLEEKPRRAFLKSVRRPNIDGMTSSAIGKKITAECRKCKYCPYCGAVNGTVKKVTGHALKIVHEKFRWYIQSTAKSKIPPQAKIDYDRSFEEAKKINPELEKHIKKAVDDMNPLRVLDLFRRIKSSDCDLLLMFDTRPESLIWQYVPAPPVSLRPSVQADATTTNEDDLTNKLGDIIQMSQIIKAGIDKGQPIQTIMEQWDYLQIQLAMYINSDVPNLQQAGFGKPMRGLCQRLKGKQGRFRGNLSGKRVDFSGRTVISPDPNLSIEEVAVPQRMAINLTYPERVTDHNIEKLKNCVRRGKKWPGANYITKTKQGGRRIALEIIARFGTDRLKPIADELEIGDVVDRHLENGDIVLFNRQPSLHKLSILSHRAVVKPWRTLRFNECVCNPYNADFDGDEMNIHVPQTEEARTEAISLMGVKHNITTPKDGTPIIAATQDFITAAYLLSSKNRFYDRKTFAQIVSYMFNADGVRDPVKKAYAEEVANRQGFQDIDLPEPTIFKPEALWTGKQVFNLLMRPNKKSKVLVNMDAACKEYKPDPALPPDLNHDDAWLVIRNSEIMCGVMDKNTLGSGKKDSIFYVILRDYGPDCLVQSMNRLAKLAARWLANEGFSIGINDVWPSAELVRKKNILVEQAYAKCDLLIKDFKEGRLKSDAGCDEELTMENQISGILSDVRQKGGAICFEQLSNWNAPTIMAKSGSKGSNINVSQMVALVGQQIIGGSRVQNGFQDRSLPHFPKASRQPPSKGFVRNSFFSGLTPYEFIFHAMSGREGLVDTAVKTAETGYMSRRLMKSLEDLSVQYDDTVRNSSSGVVQMQFGDDRLDPDDMEGKAKPVNFERTFLHSQTSKWNNDEVSLLPFEIMDKTNKILEVERKKLQRTSLFGEKLAYDDETEAGIDQFESHRDFLQTIMEFISVKAENYAHARDHVGMMDGREDDERVDWEIADDLKQRHIADGVAKVSDRTLKKFLKLCLTKYEKAKVQPGHAVGAVGAQSIGEPGTQMTLKTFHFAGVAGMSITQGVPRIKEIINASKVISTPVITCELVNKRDDEAAQLVKSRIEKTYLRDVVSWIEEVWTENNSYIHIKCDMKTIEALQLDVSIADIRRAILKARGLKLDESSIRSQGNFISVYVDDYSEGGKKRGGGRGGGASAKEQNEEYFHRVQNTKRLLPNIPLVGYPDCSRCVVSKNPKAQTENMLIVEGYGLRACMNTPGLVGSKTRSNSVMENMAVLGIEAARTTIVDELAAVMGNQMDIDPRHMQLLADVMTYKGDVLGITRFGLAKMRDSVLQLASFEKTPDHLFDAAVKGKVDGIEGVSECIIMGQTMAIGTGGMKVVRKLGMGEGEFERKATLFEDAFAEVYGKR